MSLRDERGGGLFGAVLGTGMFLVFLLMAAQLLTHLYATSVVEAAAYDAVQAVSAADGREVAQAEAHARSLLGGMSESTAFEWRVDDDEVELRVTSERAQALPGGLGGQLGIDRIEREFRMRVERFR